MDHPDGAKTGATGKTAGNAPLPNAEISKILGLVELLNSKGGRDDIYKLAAELNMEFGETLNVIRGAELLNLVNTPNGDVVLEKTGETLTRSNINKKKAIVCEQMEKIPIFKKITEYLREADDHQVTKDDVLEKLAELIPNEDAEASFHLIIQWGRYAELFGYNDDSQTFYLDVDEEVAKP